jgi:DNA invertase Pin-like site-specific DNA recombinase
MRTLRSALPQQSFFPWYAIRPQKGSVRKMTATKIAASYPRTSKDVDDAFSVESQLIANRDYAVTHNILLPSEYKFREDFTGTLMSRPELDKIRKLIREEKINTLIVYQTDRLARKVGVGDYLLDELFESGIELHIVSWGAAVRDTPDDRTRFHFEIMFGDRERRLIKERTLRGKKQKIDQGIWLGIGRTKYGYYKTGKKRETRLHIKEDEAKTILSIFECFVQYRSEERDAVIGTICDDLDMDTVPTPSVARELHNIRPRWSPPMIYNILKDECYTGRFISTSGGVARPIAVRIHQPGVHVKIGHLWNFQICGLFRRSCGIGRSHT